MVQWLASLDTNSQPQVRISVWAVGMNLTQQFILTFCPVGCKGLLGKANCGNLDVTLARGNLLGRMNNNNTDVTLPRGNEWALTYHRVHAEQKENKCHGVFER